MRTIVETDARKRISFARVIEGIKPGDRYRVEVAPDGTVILTPVIVVAARDMGAAGAAVR